jgi:large subunit ribosomal protein L6
MSRIGKQLIPLPAGTAIEQREFDYAVNGPKGTLYVPFIEGITLAVTDGNAEVTRENDERRAAHGLLRSLFSNAVIGVNKGWTKDLELHGVGMRANVAGSTLNLSLGFSHPVTFEAPAGITFLVTKNVINVSGIDKQLVGEVSAQIRKLREPEPYKGKGIRYSTEHVRRKAGKTGKK